MNSTPTIFEQVRSLLQKQYRGKDHSMLWYQKKIAELSMSPTKIMRQGKLTPTIFIGKMFLYWYDAKNKATLPYYDRFPLVIPISLTDDGFYGLNLHYLPVKYRIALLDKLMVFTNNSKMDSTTIFRLKYNFLQRAIRIPEIASCLKRYLGSHVESKFLPIDAPDWVTSVFLPVERFTVNRDQVWRDSLRKIRRAKKGSR